MPKIIRSRRLASWAFASVLLAGALQAGAQGLFGRISGTVTDANGALLPGAIVRVTNLSTNVTTTLRSDSAGVYTATSLNPGVYKVEAEAQGFKTALQSNITVEVDANPKVDMKLEVGQASEVVTITGESPLLQTQESSLSQTVDERQLDQLPVQGAGGRSVYNLVGLAAGVTQQTGEGGYALDNARLNGGRPRMDDYLLDGTSTEQPTFGGPAVTPSVDSIQELRVQTNSFSAEYGKVSGGVIEATTKSGANAFHGSAYEYLQNDAFDAKNYFEGPGPKLPLRFNEFGATLGGRIIKDKLFFFTDYQGVRSSTSSPIIDSLVPNAAFRSGDLSAIPTQLVDPATGQPYPNNQVPVGSIAQALLAVYPAGNAGPAPSTVGADYWNGTARGTTTINRLNPRVDWNISQADHIFGIYHYQRERYNSPSQFRYSNSYLQNPDDSITAGWTHVLSSSMANDFHFGYNHRNPLRSTNGYGQASPEQFGIQGIPACTLPQANGKCGAPTISIGGFTGFGAGGGALSEPARQMEFLNTFTKEIGRHDLKMGGEIRRIGIDNMQPNQVTGAFSFNGNGTGNTFGDFLIGYLGQSSVQLQTKYLMSRSWEDALFVQDDFKATRSLTLNLGLRWQYDPSWVEVHHQFASFNPYNLQWTQNGMNGAPEGSIETHWKEFSPRLGFAWNPRAGTVLRGGYGITYPGTMGHGRGGDGNASPNILATTTITPGTSIYHLPAIQLPNLNAPLTLAQAPYATYEPHHQASTYFQQWNLTVQQQLGAQTSFELAYTGSHGVHLPVNYGYNLCQQSQATVQANSAAGDSLDSPYCAPGNSAALGGFYADYVQPGWWGLSSSVYHALQAKLERRYSGSFSILTSFTWSKLIDDSSSDYGGFGNLDVYGQDFYHRSAERSVSAGDVPLRFILSPIVDLPTGPGHKWLNHGVLGEVLGGYRVSGIYSLSSGDPIGVTDGGYQFCSPAMTIGTRPTMMGNPLPPGFHQTVNQWFNTAAFDWSGTCAYTSNLLHPEGTSNPAYAFGNAPRYFSGVRAPGTNNLDASLQKEFSLGFAHESKLRFQADAFNLPNHPNFLPPDSNGDGNFGKITGTRNPGRILQLGLHLAF